VDNSIDIIPAGLVLKDKEAHIAGRNSDDFGKALLALHHDQVLDSRVNHSNDS